MNIKDFVEEWLVSEEKRNLFIHGNVGNGKLTLLKKILEKKYNICELNYLDFFIGATLDKKLSMVNAKNNIFSLINKKPKIIIFKEVEIIKTKHLTDFIKNIINKKIPLIFLGSGNCIKIKNDFINTCDFFYYEEKKNYNQKNINQHFDEKILFKNELNTELYKNINKIFNKSSSIATTNQCYELDKILSPLIIHENYKSYINKKVQSKEDKKKCILEVSKNINFAFNVQEYIFTNHYWHLQKLFSLLCCHNTSHLINQTYGGEINSVNLKLNYTSLMTKKSNIFINRKKYHENYMKIKNYHTFDPTLMEYLNKNMVLMLLDKKYAVETYEYMKEINFDKKNIHSILKFSKNFNFIEDTAKYKKIILKNIK